MLIFSLFQFCIGYLLQYRMKVTSQHNFISYPNILIVGQRKRSDPYGDRLWKCLMNYIRIDEISRLFNTISSLDLKCDQIKLIGKRKNGFQ